MSVMAPTETPISATRPSVVRQCQRKRRQDQIDGSAPAFKAARRASRTSRTWLLPGTSRARWPADIHPQWMAALPPGALHRDPKTLERTPDPLDRATRDNLVSGCAPLLVARRLKLPTDSLPASKPAVPAPLDSWRQGRVRRRRLCRRWPKPGLSERRGRNDGNATEGV
jgi:hypothetical protein